MKKTKINLLSNRDDYFKIERSLQLIRSIAVVYSVIFVIAALIFIFIQYQQNRDLQNLSDQKKTLLISLSNYKDQEAKVVIVAKKIKSYNQFILDDARFLPYYNLLNSALENSNLSKTASSTASLDSFAIDKNRVFSFTLLFGSVNEMIDSFRYIETEGFLKNFDQLTLNGLTVDSSQTTNQTDNSLVFSGKFKQISNEASN